MQKSILAIFVIAAIVFACIYIARKKGVEKQGVAQDVNSVVDYATGAKPVEVGKRGIQRAEKANQQHNEEVNKALKED